MELTGPRMSLRDFTEADRAAFVAYQCDWRYRRLYGLEPDAASDHAHALFDDFVAWRRQTPRRNFQLGAFLRSGTLFGCGGLRGEGQPQGSAVLGIELAPAYWGRYGLAAGVAAALIDHAFREMGLRLVVSDSASGNTRAARLAEWFGATVTSRGDGPDWMTAHGWHAVDWRLTLRDWKASPAHHRFAIRNGELHT